LDQSFIAYPKSSLSMARIS